MSSPQAKSPPCQQFACAIQDCLQRNDYQEAKCRSSLNALKECCEKLLKEGGSSPCCPQKKS
ncbi:uncharacterized protein BX664DRAFT_324139 [Halteromyces radiatus]|uniref:uncharacterized protein n=1 Tax=Halteromyces radiatus TaxID=101107 RepID=UPI0022208F2D|nr:uncharacterized protein BX664DRAFT_324139 [Halteromyces radiatus]KAI8096500.1 hypothetical protein BX664DRAFT_324139 [Halteromyces radiatus]